MLNWKWSHWLFLKWKLNKKFSCTLSFPHQHRRANGVGENKNPLQNNVYWHMRVLRLIDSHCNPVPELITTNCMDVLRSGVFTFLLIIIFSFTIVLFEWTHSEEIYYSHQVGIDRSTKIVGLWWKAMRSIDFYIILYVWIICLVSCIREISFHYFITHSGLAT